MGGIAHQLVGEWQYNVPSDFGQLVSAVTRETPALAAALRAVHFGGQLFQPGADSLLRLTPVRTYDCEEKASVAVMGADAATARGEIVAGMGRAVMKLLLQRFADAAAMRKNNLGTLDTHAFSQCASLRSDAGHHATYQATTVWTSSMEIGRRWCRAFNGPWLDGTQTVIFALPSSVSKAMQFRMLMAAAHDYQARDPGTALAYGSLGVWCVDRGVGLADHRRRPITVTNISEVLSDGRRRPMITTMRRTQLPPSPTIARLIVQPLDSAVRLRLGMSVVIPALLRSAFGEQGVIMQAVEFDREAGVGVGLGRIMSDLLVRLQRRFAPFVDALAASGLGAFERQPDVQARLLEITRPTFGDMAPVVLRVIFGLPKARDAAKQLATIFAQPPERSSRALVARALADRTKALCAHKPGGIQPNTGAEDDPLARRFRPQR